MKDTKEKINNAHVLGFIGGAIFANAVHAAIIFPAVALRLGAKGKHNFHRSHCHHDSHEAAGPVHFLAQQHAQEAKDEHALLGDIKADLDDIKASLKEKTPQAPEPPKDPEPPKPDEGPAPEPPEPDKKDEPEPPKP
ncbi:hypothetical protein [Ligilactobacillus acidipiscis]|uniref:hypothetical protein n=1 Tax=Ligilactobacillus acidipiscis TaxID=89059 RepID=UPI0022DF03A9|nr:hypothetical protein [Ligilactobacillus acidipiscis]